MPPTSTSRNQRRRQPTRLSQPSTQPRRPSARTAEPPDYSRDYAYVRSDLIRITIIGSLMFALMIGAAFFI
jgi:hypothetical protein